MSEEEREPSVYPTSHSDSTPSQSEEEDEVSGNGKGESASCQAMKRSSPNEGIRASQSEMPAQLISPLLAPHSHQRLKERHFPRKGVRSAANLFPHKYSGHDSQEGRLLPSLNNTDEGETQNSQGQGQAGGHLGQANSDPSRAQWVKLEATPKKTGKKSHNGNLTSRGDNKAGQEFQKPHTTKYSKEANNQEANFKGQLEGPKTTDQESCAGRAQFQNGTQLVWKNLGSSFSTCGKQDGVQRWKVKCLKKARVMGHGPGDNPRWSDQAGQDTKYILLADTAKQENPLTFTTKRQEELNANCAEKVTDQSLAQDRRESEDTSSSIHLGSHRGMTCQRDNQLKQVDRGLSQPEGNKQDDHQREIFKDGHQIQNYQKGPKSATAATETQFGCASSSGQSLESQGSPTVAPDELGKQFDGQETKAILQRKTQIGWEQRKATAVKDNSPSLRLCADSLALQKQSLSTRQDGQQPTVLETDPSLNPHVESCSDNGQQLASTDSTEGALENQLPCGGLEPSSLLIQQGPERSQESERVLAEQGQVTVRMGSPSAGKQTLKPTLNPSRYDNTFETEEGSCGPSGDHTPVPTSPGKTVTMLPPQHSNQGCSRSHGNDESSGPSCFKVHSAASTSESDMKSLDEFEEGATKTSLMVPELPARSTKDRCKYGKKGEEDEEDEELATFSSLLASKLNLSAHSGHILSSSEQRDMMRSLVSHTGKQGAKTRHYNRDQVFQNPVVQLSKNMDANQTVYRSHKRKGNNAGTRRSKRLRIQ